MNDAQKIITTALTKSDAAEMRKMILHALPMMGVEIVWRPRGDVRIKDLTQDELIRVAKAALPE